MVWLIFFYWSGRHSFSITFIEVKWLCATALLNRLLVDSIRLGPLINPCEQFRSERERRDVGVRVSQRGQNHKGWDVLRIMWVFLCVLPSYISNGVFHFREVWRIPELMRNQWRFQHAISSLNMNGLGKLVVGSSLHIRDMIISSLNYLYQFI